MVAKTQQDGPTRLSRQLSYDRVKKNVLDMIRQERLQPGDRLPSERELSKRFGLNHLTIRKGLASLVEEKIIDRRVGAGTFLRFVPVSFEGNSVSGPDGSVAGSGVEWAFIGVLVLPKMGSFVQEMLGQLHAEAERRGFSIHIRMISDLGSGALDVLRQMARQGGRAALIPWLTEGISLTDLGRLVQDSPIPIVLTKPLPGLEASSYEKPSSFGRGDYVAIEMACRYFRALGFGRIAFFGPDNQSTDTLSRRVLAYTRFVNRQGLETHVGLVTSEAGDVDRVVKGWSRFAGDLAVVCFDDDFAILLMTALHKHDLRIPEDVAVLGFNNVPLGSSTDPPLSTIQFDYHHVAVGMLNHAEALVRGESDQVAGDPRQTLLVRQSCGGRLRAGERLADVVEHVQMSETKSEHSSSVSV